MYNFKELDDYLANSLEKFDTNCLCVLISNNGKPVYDFYIADTSINEYANFSTYSRFNIGSLSELYIGILILKLIESGEITSDDYVKTYIPEFANEKIKIIHLMTNQIQKSYSSYQEDNTQEFIDSIRNSKDNDLYLDYSYSILADIIQHVTGKDIDTYANEEIFKPLALTRTSLSFDKTKRQNIINPYNSDTGSFMNFSNIPIIGHNTCFVSPLELLYLIGTFQDFYHGRNTTLLNKHTFKYSLTPAYFDGCTTQLKTPIFNNRGSVDTYGFFGDLNSIHTFGKTGNTGCMVSIDLDNDVSIVIVSNNTNFDDNKQKYKKIINKIMTFF